MNVLLGLKLAAYNNQALAMVAGVGIAEAFGLCYGWWRWSNTRNDVSMLKRQVCDRERLDLRPNGMADSNAFLLAEDDGDSETGLKK